MTSVPMDKACTVPVSKAGCTATGVEKKRKLSSSSEHCRKIKQIKRALAEVITEIDPVNARTSEIFGHLTTAHRAIETASDLLADTSQMQRTLTEQSRSDCQLTMVERATLFHQWQANRTAQTCQTDETFKSEGR